MISFPYGARQRFRYRHGDINVLAVIDGNLPLRRSEWFLNGGPPTHFYVEPDVPVAVGPYAWETNSPSVFRLQGKTGWANLEIPITASELREGDNDLEVRVEDAGGNLAGERVRFTWDPRPVALPVDLSDLRGVTDLQSVGQAVNGVFEIDPDRGVVRTVEPIGPDVLLLLGSPTGSQEATYVVEFGTDGRTGTYIGLSDYFVGHSEQEPGLGIKPGYSTAGLATIAPGGWAQMWIARGDCLVDKPWAWLERSRYPSRYPVQPGVRYRVRHQCIIEPHVNLARFRLWPDGDAEPTEWLCVEDNADLAPGLERLVSASFGLFQFGGHATEWSEISLRRLSVTEEMIQAALARPRRRGRGLANKINKAIHDRMRWRASERRPAIG